MFYARSGGEVDGPWQLAGRSGLGGEGVRRLTALEVQEGCFAPAGDLGKGAAAVAPADRCGTPPGADSAPRGRSRKGLAFE